MNVSTNRNFARSYYEADLMFSDSRNGDYNKARMVNCCVNGICFEADNALQPGFDVCIKMPNHEPDMEFSPEAYKILRGRVKWCRELDETCRYGIGVQFHECLNKSFFCPAFPWQQGWSGRCF
ncbi:MAG: PilZ domain-containing protein [Desulfobacteraceae bacterium]|nr:MAG: PilZ domain-containing protein [Desulfobacteraceae bacterium]